MVPDRMYLSVEIKVYIRDTKYIVQFIDALNSSKNMKCFSSHYDVQRQIRTFLQHRLKQDKKWATHFQVTET